MTGEVVRCEWATCRAPILDWRPGQRFCSQRCRQTAHRLRRLGPGAAPRDGARLRFVYYDPPYPGTARKYYGDQPTYAGEVDHAALIACAEGRRHAGEIAGWALSTSENALRDVLSLCPQGTRVCPWVKPIGVSPATYGPHNTWEPLLVVGGRKRQGVRVRDWLRAMPARGGGTLPGRKPLAFCSFLFDQLGMIPGDELEDAFPGTGVVLAAWQERSRSASSTDRDAATG